MDMPTKKQEKAYETLSPFEVKNVLIEMASKHARAASSVMLNAGRGNPNWIATEPREAFFTLGRFAITESRRVWDEGILAGLPEKEGMGSRLAGWLDVNSMMPGADCLKRSFQYGVNILGFDADEWAYELCDGILGCHYPTPDRIMPCCESAVREYIIKELEQGGAQDQDFDLFATEVATAAMVYIFRSLLNNGLLKPGDTIALGTPIFTPYIEIPNLPWYSFKTVQVYADGTELVGGEPRHSWQYSDRELEKLADRQVKVFFIVNPSNPGSVEISPETAQKIKNIVTAKNPQLMIVTDDVYSSFADDYRSLFDTIPYNTICSYSFSKYFGCTGWRLGVIGIHRKNVFDDMIAAMPAAQRIKTAKLYAERSGEDKIYRPHGRRQPRHRAEPHGGAVGAAAGADGAIRHTLADRQDERLQPPDEGYHPPALQGFLEQPQVAAATLPSQHGILPAARRLALGEGKIWRGLRGVAHEEL